MSQVYEIIEGTETQGTETQSTTTTKELNKSAITESNIDTKPKDISDLVKIIIEAYPNKIFDVPAMFYDVEYISEEDQMKLVRDVPENAKYIKNLSPSVKKYLMVNFDYRIPIIYFRNINEEDVIFYNDYYPKDTVGYKYALVCSQQRTCRPVPFAHVPDIIRDVDLSILLKLPFIIDELQMKLFEHNKKCVIYILNPCPKLKTTVITKYPKYFNMLQNVTDEDKKFHKLVNGSNSSCLIM